MKKPVSFIQRRNVLKAVGAGFAAGTAGMLGAPAFAQNKPVRIGIIAPRGGTAGTIGECGVRGAEWTASRINAGGGIGGRMVELVIQ
jgi:branched-chain amino acid transport system substrate-binding protein